MIEILFWIGLIVTLWGVGGYAPFAWLWARLVPLTRPAPDLPDGQLPTITVVIAAWNEGAVLTEKLRNTRAMDYPESLVRILFVTDGSSDASPEMLAREPDVTVLHRPERMGKAAAMNRAMRHVETEIVVFTDANAMLNHTALRRIAARYQDSRVGAVAGEKRVLAQASGSVSGAGEGLYWRYESWLKRLDSDLWSVAGAAGELFSLRTDLWEPLPEDTLLDDFVVSLRAAARGYRIAYAPDAWASESPSANLKEEWKRKVRIAAGGFQSMRRLSGLFSVPRLAFVYVSHRVLRWTIIPAMLPVLPVLSITLAARTGDPYYLVMASLMAAGALASAFAWYRLDREQSAGILTPLFYFVFMNAAVWVGALRFLRGRQQVTWERAVRHAAVQRL